MKYALFLQKLWLSRKRTRDLLQLTTQGKYDAVWLDDPRLERLCNDVEILVTSKHEVNSDVLAPWPCLKMISLAFTGYDRVDMAYCRARGLKVYYVPDYSTKSVAELTVGLTLSLLRKIVQGDQSTRQGKWDKPVNPGIELFGKKVGILGTGTIGIRSAKLFQAFGCQVVGYSRSRRDGFLELGLRYVKINEIFRESDVIVLHLPVNEDTRHIVGARRIKLMRPTSILINTARSELVDNDALYDALKQKRILGAGIDVFDDEDHASADPLSSLKNVIVTPHLGFKTKEALERLAKNTVLNIGNFLSRSSENLVP